MRGLFKLIKKTRNKTQATTYQNHSFCISPHFSSKALAMAQDVSFTRLLNPWLLHLRKMGLELRCLLCLNLLNRPLLLPCDHIFCGSCITNSVKDGSHCPFCKSHFDDRDARPVAVLENMVSIYRSLDGAFAQCLSQADLPDFARSVNQCKLFANPCGDDTKSNATIGAPGNKRVRAPLQSLEHENIEKSGMTKGSADDLDSTRMEGPVEYSEMLQPNGEQINGDHFRDMDLNQQVTQMSTGSPPSLAEVKDSDDDNGDHGFQHSATEQLVKGVCKRDLEDDTKNYRASVSLGKKDTVIETKRQKLDPRLEEMAVDGVVHEQEMAVDGVVHEHSIFYDAENASTSKHEAATQLSRPSFHVESCGASDASDSHSAVICAFCQSSDISEEFGPMLHYLNGEPVEGDALNQPDVLHVHRNCINWAPQVYYVGETVKNLEVELARGAKLKCSNCGLKGAALGCYAKSCRKSFHAPCAVQVLGCRWDPENFLMLCPTHSSLKFPRDRSKSKNSGKNHSSMHPIASQQFKKEWADLASTSSKWVLCGSALSSAEKNLLAKFARITGATVSKIWNPNVTHVIAATDGNGACSRTLKVLMAILHGRWILKIDWIKACMEALHPLSEEPFEIDLDVHGCCNGPKRGRLRIMEKAPKLFNGLNFYLSGDFLPSYKGYLEDLLLAAGGVVLENEMLVSQQYSNTASGSRAIVVYSLDPPSEGALEDAFSVLCNREEAGDLATKTGSFVVGHTWILESIAACELQPFA